MSNYQAARNFRNIWFHYPEKFDEFRAALIQTWPGMDIKRPEVDRSHERPRLHMFCLEGRISREIFWAGFGFQVWCQMLTHLIQSGDRTLFLIDEPDIYLHSDLQRQLLSLLRSLGPDILIATHSTEIMTEAEPDDIVLINKNSRQAKRVRYPAQLGAVFEALGSNLNPILTQLAKTRRAIFVEGRDFQIIEKFARKLGVANVANRAEFAVIPVDGFNPERAKNLKEGMELTLGGKIEAAVIFDRDFRSDAECTAIAKACSTYCSLVVLHNRKEIENFLLIPAALDRAAAVKVLERRKRDGKKKGVEYDSDMTTVLDAFAAERKSHITAQHLGFRRRFERINSPTVSEETISEHVLKEIETIWSSAAKRFHVVPGKEAMNAVNLHLQDRYSVHLAPSTIIDAMRVDEIPEDMKLLISKISTFASSKVQGETRRDDN